MFSKILVPLDLTSRHRPALDAASELAKHSGGDVTLVHVIELIVGLSKEDEQDFYGRIERAAQEHLDKFIGYLVERQISTQGEILYGNRAQEVTRYAKQSAADLIILTAPRIDTENPISSWASLSYKIGILSPCPVLLVK